MDDQGYSVGAILTKNSGYMLEDNWSRVVVDAVDGLGMYALIPWHARSLPSKELIRIHRWVRCSSVHDSYVEDGI